jgi:hypothetical protein
VNWTSQPAEELEAKIRKQVTGLKLDPETDE